MLALCAAPMVSGPAYADRATECTAINICYCVEQNLKGAIDTNVSKVRQAIAEQKSAGKAIGYLSIPISTVGGAYFGVNVDVAAKTKAAVEKRFGAEVSSRFSIPEIRGSRCRAARTAPTTCCNGTRALEGPSGTGDDFDFFYFSGLSDFAAALGLTGEGDMDKIDALLDQRYAADEKLPRCGRRREGRARPCSGIAMGMKASIMFSYGSHDEWNILRLINVKRLGGTQFGVAEQIASFYDGHGLRRLGRRAAGCRTVDMVRCNF